jgi:hypothetical protein
VWDGGIFDDVIFTPTVTKTYNVTGTDDNGCQNRASALVNIHPLPIVTAQSHTICEGQHAILSGNGAINYSWDGGIFNNSAFALSKTQTFTVIGTDINGCKSGATATITVNPMPSVYAVSKAVCKGQSTVLEGNGAIAYFWSDGITDKQTFTPTRTKNYIVTGTNGNGCESTAKATVIVNLLPDVIAQPVSLIDGKEQLLSNPAIICSGFPMILRGSGQEATYVWDQNMMNNVVFIPGTTQSYNVTGTDKYGCQNTASATIVVNPLPSVTALALPSVICDGDYSLVYATGADSYQWNIPVETGSVQPHTSTYYSVTGTDVNGCINTSSVTLHVNPLPTVTATANPPIICKGTSATLIASGAVSYDWDAVSSTVSPTKTTRYHVTGIDEAGCLNTSSTQVTVLPVPVLKLFGDTTICENSTKVPYTVIPDDSTHSFIWSVTGSRIMYSVEAGAKYNLKKQIDWMKPGFDTILVSEFNGTCYGYAVLPIQVSPHAKPSINWELQSGTYDIQLTNKTDQPVIEDKGAFKKVDFTYFTWNFGRETDLPVKQSNASYLNDSVYTQRYQYGDYDVLLVSVNDYCIDSTTKKINLDMQEALFVPNSFQPESNVPELSLFRPKGFNLESYKISIYDIWGNLLWYSDKLINGNPLEGWDGTYNGTVMKLDTYIWKVEASFRDGSVWQGQASSVSSKKMTFGNVLLIR